MFAVIKPLALIGMMGAGKSTVAQLVAARMNCPAYDLDQLIEHRLGRAIHEIFAESGESVFRTVERLMLAQLAHTAQSPYVVAVGGGTPVDRASRQVLRRVFHVVWLDGTPALLFERAYSPDRPLTAGGMDAFGALAEARRSIYEETADLRVQTDVSQPDQTAAAIVLWWKEQTDDQSE